MGHLVDIQTALKPFKKIENNWNKSLWSYYNFSNHLTLSQLRICRPPPLRSGHLDIRDAQCAETKDRLKILHHFIRVWALWASKRGVLSTQKFKFKTFGRPKRPLWTPIAPKRDMMWYEIFSTTMNWPGPIRLGFLIPILNSDGFIVKI